MTSSVSAKYPKKHKMHNKGTVFHTREKGLNPQDGLYEVAEFRNSSSVFHACAIIHSDERSNNPHRRKRCIKSHKSVSHVAVVFTNNILNRCKSA